MDQLQERMGEELEVQIPGGGLALWIRFKQGLMASQWIDAMRIRGLVLNQPCTYFMDQPGPYTCMGFAQCSEEVLELAVDRMQQALQDIS